MTITFDQCRRAIHGALRREPGPHRTAADIVNGFGRWWATAHAWEYLEGQRTDLEVGPSADVYDLPADLARLDSIRADNGYVVPITIVSGWADFERSRNLSPGYVLESGATTRLTGIVRHGAGRTPQLEINQAPTAATWRLRYRAGWSGITSEGTAPLPLPWYAEQAFLEGVAVYALALERSPEDGSASLVSGRLGEFMEGALMQAAMSQDGELSGGTTATDGPIGMRLDACDSSFGMY